jgi:6-phosphogluconolactonase (cycloisomerase 2 family)
MDSISSLVVAEDGTLSRAPGSPLAMTGVFLGTGVVQNGKYAYVNDYEGDAVHGFEVAKSGELSAIAGSPWTTGGDHPIGLSAGNNVVISANQNLITPPNSLSSFRVGKGGVLTPAPNSPVTPSGESVDVDPKGRFAYSENCGSPGIFGFAIDKKTAELIPLAGSPFATATASDFCGGVAPTRKGAIALTRFKEFQVFSRGKDGALATPAAPVVTGFRDSHALTKNEKIIVAAEDSTGTVGTFAFDRKTGSITPIDSDSITGASMAQATVIVKR